MKKIISIIAMLCTTLSLTACSGGETVSDSGRRQVYTSFYAMYDLTSEIAGDKADVYSMCPVGTEPHDYEPKTTDMAKLTEADIFVYNGGGMESWAEKSSDTLKDVKTVCVSDHIEKLENSDPHSWLYPINALKAAEAIKNALAECDPNNSAAYEVNYEGFKTKAEELDAKYRSMSAAAVKKDIVVAHEAYGYLCDAYGLNQIAVESVQGGEPSPTRMAEIISYMRENNIGYICAEELASSKAVETIAAETGAETVTLNPFEGDTGGKGYFEVMNENLEVIEKILK
ncbi:MAG: zinc ABC transporter substrate-binding protein [bacterium]|nr:zinc ABC transporter substrate-binding protein [bacterium]